MPTPTIPNPLEEARALVKHWRAISARASERVSANPTDAMSLNYAVTISECADALDALLPRLALIAEELNEEEAREAMREAARQPVGLTGQMISDAYDAIHPEDAAENNWDAVAERLNALRGQPVGLTEEQVEKVLKPYVDFLAVHGGDILLRSAHYRKATAALNAALHASAPASATVQEGQQPTSDPPSQRLSSTSRVVPSGPEASGHSTAADSDRAKLERLVMFTYRNFGPYQVYSDIAALLATFEASESERGKS